MIYKSTLGDSLLFHYRILDIFFRLTRSFFT